MEKFNKEQKEAILALNKHIGYDGHTLWSPEVLKDFPEALQKRFIRDYKSGNTYKSTIFGNDGKAVAELQGSVYGLTVLLAVCNDLGIKVDSYMGRGFQAQACSEAIEKFFA